MKSVNNIKKSNLKSALLISTNKKPLNVICTSHSMVAFIQAKQNVPLTHSTILATDLLHVLQFPFNKIPKLSLCIV